MSGTFFKEKLEKRGTNGQLVGGVLYDVQRFTRPPCNMTTAQIATAITTEDKRIALYKKYNGEADGGAYLKHVSTGLNFCVPTRTGSDYTRKMRELEARLNGIGPALPSALWGP